MKNVLIILSFMSCVSLSAQPPRGGFPGGREGGGRRPPMEKREGGERQEFGIMNLPEIPGLTDKQRDKLTKTLSKEQKEINKINIKKDNIRVQTENPSLNANEVANGERFMAKLDEKAANTKAKYDKKYQSILTEEQYQVFTKHRDAIEFRRPPRRNEFPGPNSKGHQPGPPEEEF